MKAFADKILCGCGVAALVASGAWTFMSLGGVQAQDISNVANSPAGVKVDPVSAPSASVEAPDWKSPVSQDPEDANWVYGVFTPPKIYEDNGYFSAVPPKIEGTGPTHTIDVELIEMAQKLYRFQFEGYVEEDASDPRKNLAMLLDRETNFAVRARVGREFPNEGIRILDLDIQRSLDADGVVSRIERVTIQEIATGLEVILENGIDKYEEDVSIKIRSSFTGDIVEIDAETTTFELNDLTYALINVDVPNSQVTVRKPIEGEEGEEDFLTETLEIVELSTDSISSPATNLPLF
ncbi:MAG: hypothetical protein ACPGN3_04170 [Opitutales bacterium]